MKLVEGKSWNARPTIKMVRGVPHPATEFHVGWVNFLREDNKWQEIDCTFLDKGDHFEITKAPFSISLPKVLNQGEIKWTGDNKWDIFDKKTIDDTPIDLTFEHIGSQNVPGVIEGEHKDRVVYKNAYPEYNADVVYYIHHGRAPRLRKLIVFNSKPTGTEDIRIPFRITYPSGSEIKRWKHRFNHHDPRWDEKTMRSQVNLTPWNKAKLTTQNGLSFRPPGADPKSRRGLRLKDPRVWDNTLKAGFERPDDWSMAWESRKWQPIDWEVEHEEEGSIIATKIIPRQFLEEAIYPVFTDTTSTFYPDHDTETTTVDGMIRKREESTWSDAHDAATGDEIFDTTDPLGFARARHGASGYFIERGVFLFDISAIGGGISVSSATLSLYLTATAIGDDDSEEGVGVVVSAPASDTGLVAGDYDSLGTTLQGTAVDMTGASTGAYKDWALDSNGKGTIETAADGDGIVKFGTREEHDRQDVSIADNSNNEHSANNAEQAGLTKDPKLVVVYIIGTYTLSVSDQLTVSESVTVENTTLGPIDVSDQLTVSESITMLVDFNIDLSDQLTISESVTMENLTLGPIDVSDQLTVSENIVIDLTSFIDVSDQLTVSESVSLEFIHLVNVSDQLTVSESLTVEVPALGNIDVSDQLTVSESVTLQVPALGNIDVSDQLTISESISMENVITLSVNDQITISESVTVERIIIIRGLANMKSKQQDYPASMDDTTII